MRSKELEQFWLKNIEQKNISDEEYDNKPLVYDDVELSAYEKQMIKTMLAGIVTNKKVMPAS